MEENNKKDSEKIFERMEKKFNKVVDENLGGNFLTGNFAKKAKSFIENSRDMIISEIDEILEDRNSNVETVQKTVDNYFLQDENIMYGLIENDKESYKKPVVFTKKGYFMLGDIVHEVYSVTHNGNYLGYYKNVLNNRNTLQNMKEEYYTIELYSSQSALYSESFNMSSDFINIEKIPEIVRSKIKELVKKNTIKDTLTIKIFDSKEDATTEGKTILNKEIEYLQSLRDSEDKETV